MIECTATDLTKAHIVLHTIIAGFGEYCEEAYVTEPVPVQYDNGNSYVTPTLQGNTFQTSASYINRNLGTDFTPAFMKDLLAKMSLDATVDGDNLTVYAPVTRSDVLHAVDIVEDVAIAYGYNNLTRSLPSFPTIASQQPLNKLTDQIRQNIAMCG